jgi:hypothetical protein
VFFFVNGIFFGNPVIHSLSLALIDYTWTSLFGNPRIIRKKSLLSKGGIPWAKSAPVERVGHKRQL